MARTVATLPTGSRITDFMSFGILARAFPIAKVHEALAVTGKASQRQRDLPEMSKFPVRRKSDRPQPPVDIINAIRIIK